MIHVTLDTTCGEAAYAKEIDTNYLIVDALSLYKIIIGRLDINLLGAVISTIYIVLKHSLPGGLVGVIRGDQQIAQCSYLSSLEIEREKSSHWLRPLLQKFQMMASTAGILDWARRRKGSRPRRT